MFKSSFLSLVTVFALCSHYSFAQISLQDEYSADVESAIADFIISSGSNWVVEWNTDFDWPSLVYLGSTTPLPENTEKAALEYIKKRSNFFRIPNQVPNKLTLQNKRTYNGVTHYRFEQNFFGIPVEDAFLGVHVAADRSIDMISNSLVPLTPGRSAPSLSASDAAFISNHFIPKKFGKVEAEEARLLYTATSDEPGVSLAWHFSKNDFDVWVDSETGEVLRKGYTANFAIYPSEFETGPTLSHTSSASSKATSNRDTASGYTYAVHPNTSSLSTTTLNRLDALYEITGLVGEWADVLSQIGTRAQVDANDDFMYGTSDAEELSQVNIYYHIDKIREEFVSDELDFDDFDEQIVWANANNTFDDEEAPNAKYSTSNDKLYFQNGLVMDPAGTTDIGLEAIVIYHEYMHHVFHEVNSKLAGGFYFDQSRGVQEGLADYFAYYFSGDDDILDYAFPSYERTIDSGGNSSVQTCINEGTGYTCGTMLTTTLDAIADNVNVDEDLFIEILFGAANRISTLTMKNVAQSLIAEDRAVNQSHYIAFVEEEFEAIGTGDVDGPDDLEVLTDGLFCLDENEIGYFSTSVLGGRPPYSYDWQFYQDCEGSPALPCDSWTSVGSQSTLDLSNHQDFSLKVEVTDDNDETDWSGIRNVQISSSCSAPYNGEGSTLDIRLKQTSDKSYAQKLCMEGLGSVSF